MRKAIATFPLDGESYRKFVGSINNKETLESYTRYLTVACRYFRGQYSIQSIDELLKIEQRHLEDMIIALFNHMKQLELSYAYVNGCKSSLKHLCVQNDVLLNWDKLVKYLPEQKRLVEDRAYTRDEIRRVLSFMTPRDKVAVMIMASTGMRVGGLVGLKMKHLQRIDRLYKFMVYANTRDKYVTFCSPECASLIDEYFDQRKRIGEIIDGNSPVIRDVFATTRKNLRHSEKQKHGSPITVEALRGNILYSLQNAGVRTPKSKINRRASGRHEVMIMHGFRKFFNTQLARAKVDKVIKEKLMGHSVGLEASYLRLDDSELLEEYLKAVPFLAIQDTFELTRENNELKEKLQATNVEGAKLEQVQQDLIAMQNKLDYVARIAMKFGNPEVAKMLNSVRQGA